VQYLVASQDGRISSGARLRTGLLSSAEGRLELTDSDLQFVSSDKKRSVQLKLSEVARVHATFVGLELTLRNGEKFVFAFGTGTYMHMVGQVSATRTISHEWKSVIESARERAVPPE
jgi:hypothetical protein